jgi:Uma2 family endonuclease
MHTKDDMTLAVHQPPSRLPARKSRRRTAMTYQQFLQADLGHDHFEWVDGEVIEMPAVENIHAALSLLLSRALADWLDENGGGEVRNDPFQMHLSSRPSGRQPDIQVLRPKTLTRLKRMYLDGPAPVDDEKGHFHSRMLPGVWLDVDWLWKLPPKKQILKLWGV